MSKITYIPGDTIIYKLNPIVKGLCSIILIILFSIHNFGFYVTTTSLLILTLVLKIFKIPLRDIFNSLKNILVLLFIVGLFQGYSNGSFDWKPALDACFKIIGVFIAAGMFVTVSSQSELIYFWETFFKPLDMFGISSKELALVMVIAVRFMPVIFNELDRIKMAQMARGANFDGKSGLVSKARGLLPLLVPTISLSIMRASELAVAMEARGYRVASKRTRYYEFNLKFIDILAIFAMILLISAYIHYTVALKS